MKFLDNSHPSAAGVSHAVGKLSRRIRNSDVGAHIGILGRQRLPFRRVPCLRHLQHPLLVGDFAFPHLLVETLFLNQLQIIEARLAIRIEMNRLAEFRLRIHPLPVLKIEMTVPQQHLNLLLFFPQLGQFGQRLFAGEPPLVRALDDDVKPLEVQRLPVPRIDVQHLLRKIRSLGELPFFLFLQGL